MNKLRQAAQQALEALDNLHGAYRRAVGLINRSQDDSLTVAAHNAGAALRAALAEPEQPVAWVNPLWINPDTRGWPSDSFESLPVEGWLPLYTAPTPRKPLSLDEIQHCADEAGLTVSKRLRCFVRAIERAHGIGDSK